MTNKEYYGFTDELVEAIKFPDKPGCVFANLETAIQVFHLKTAVQVFLNFCIGTKCQKCPFYENDKEHCFIQWLNTEVEK